MTTRREQNGRIFRNWFVPFCYQGREIDGVNITASTAAGARRQAKVIWTDRGYTTEKDYSIGKPYRDDGLRI